MIGLKDKADMVTPQLRQLFRRQPRGGAAADTDRSHGWRQHAAKHGQQRCLAAAGRSHQHYQLSTAERQAHSPQRLHPSGALAEKFDDVARFHHWIAHRVNTTAGSVRMMWTIAAIAENTHIATVSKNRPAIRPGGISTGRAESAVALTMTMPIAAAMPKPTAALKNAWIMMTV